MKKIFVLLVLLIPAFIFAQDYVSVYAGLTYANETRLSAETCLLPSCVSLNGGTRVDAAFNGSDIVFYPLFLRLRFGAFTLDAGGGIDEIQNFVALATAGAMFEIGAFSLFLRGGIIYRGSVAPLIELGLVAN